MGKLTKSLKAVSQQLNDVHNGINQMQELGEELGKNSFRVAEAALRTGYAYAKAETEETISHPLLPNSSPVLDKDLLKGANSWTQEALKARFGTCKEAYAYLRKIHHIKLSSRSWKNIITAFNGTIDDITIDQKVTQLEQTVVQQAQQILFLEEKINQMEIQLQHLLKERFAEE